MTKNKLVFNTKSEDGKDLELAVVRPSPKVLLEAKKVYNKTFAQAANNGELFREKLEEHLIEQGVWSPEKEVKQMKLMEQIVEKEEKLRKGGIPLSDAKAIAIELKILRWERKTLLSSRTDMDSVTVEGQSDNAQFNYLVANCTVYNNDGKPYFDGIDDYNNRITELAAIDGATKFLELWHGIDTADDNLPENQFLTKHKLMNSEGRLIDSQGRFIDLKGRLVNETGDLINEEGELVDEEGKVLETVSNEPLPFLDSEGKPIEV